MPKIAFTEIQKLEIFDCRPGTEEQKVSYWDELEEHLWIPSDVAWMRGGRKKPLVRDISRNLDSLELALENLKKSLTAFDEVCREEKYPPIPGEMTAKTEAVSTLVSDLKSLHIKHVPYLWQDDRRKNFEGGLINVALGLWYRHFPGHLPPLDPRQGRFNGSHEPAPALRLCGIIIKAATGKSQEVPW